MFNDNQNPDVLDAKTIDLVGGYRLFVPEKGSIFYDAGKKPIHLGHVRAPTETYTPTTKKIDTAVYGTVQTALEITTKTEESGAFESISAKDLIIRGLWAGSKAVASGAAIAAVAFQANHTYAAGDLVTPTEPNGHYYEVTVAGDSSGVEPVSWKTDGGTNTSGTVTFTDKGVAPAGGLVVIRKNHASFSGMLIDVVQSAIADRTPEISVLPNITLRGDGYGGGRNGTDETSLKFAYTVLSAGKYTIPADLGNFGVEAITGGYDILNVPVGGEDAVIQKLITGYYA